MIYGQSRCWQNASSCFTFFREHRGKWEKSGNIYVVSRCTHRRFLRGDQTSRADAYPNQQMTTWLHRFSTFFADDHQIFSSTVRRPFRTEPMSKICALLKRTNKNRIHIIFLINKLINNKYRVTPLNRSNVRRKNVLTKYFQRCKRLYPYSYIVFRFTAY